MLPDDLDVASRPVTYLTWEIRSGDGTISCVDVTYPAAPIFMASSNDLLKASVRPVLDYVGSGRWLYTKTDWEVWTATLADSREDFEALMRPVYGFVTHTPQRVPLPMTRYAGAYHVFAFGVYGPQEDDAYHGKESWWGSPYDTKVFAPWPASDSPLQLHAWRVRVFGAYGATGQCGTNRYLAVHAAALYSASRLLGRLDLQALADEPWSQCMITGIGHRNPLPYQTMIGDVSGSMYQGIGSQDGDTPYFSPYCFYSQREIWGVCGGLYLMAAAIGAR